ncbi:bacteriocin [Dolosigranulum pigrum]|nr:bacteriocin [Dolosigranulum pigrum]
MKKLTTKQLKTILGGQYHRNSDSWVGLRCLFNLRKNC